jgi:hypothetical protein
LEGLSLDRFEPVSLAELDERAALQRRVDQKYLVDAGRLAQLLDALCPDHVVLEIDGGRTFDYRSTYFDTPELKCFFDHVRDVVPRYKLRTRRYVTTHACAFEVKIKQEDGETVKHSVDHGADEGEITPEARRLIDRALRGAGLEPPGELETTLVTEFARSTLALRDGGERVTIDRGVRLSHGDESLVLRDDFALLESKNEDGEGRADRVLAELGAQPISLSKYRLGIGRLACHGADPGYAEELDEGLERERRVRPE